MALILVGFLLLFCFPRSAHANQGDDCISQGGNIHGWSWFWPSSVTVGPGQSLDITLYTVSCNPTAAYVDNDTVYFTGSSVNGYPGVIQFPYGNSVDMGALPQGWYSIRTLTVRIDGNYFNNSGYYNIILNGYGQVTYGDPWRCNLPGLPRTCNTNVGAASVGLNVVLPQGHIQITKYGPNGQGNFSEPRFNLCAQGYNGICTGAGGHSNNVAVDPGTYYVLKTNNNYPPNGPDPPPDGWYIDHAQLGTPGSNVAADVFGRFPYTVTSNGQTWADIYLQKYAATCGNSDIFSFNGSTTTPKAGDKFAMNFGMSNPGGITNWTWPTTKLHVKVPAGVTPISSLNGQAVGSFDWQPATRDLYIAPPSYNTIYSGQSVNYTAFFQYDAGSSPGDYTYVYNMVFPSNSVAWVYYATYGNTTYIKNCNGTSPLVRPTFYPWLQTKNGDVLARGTVIGQDFFKPGSRSDTSFGSELDYLLLSPGQNNSPAAKQFCSLNRYVLGRDMSKQCSAGLYDFTQQDFGDIQKAVSKTWERNGAGAGGSCTPYKTSTGNLPSGNISPGCAGGTMYKKIGNTNLSSFVSGAGAQSVSLGRATVWVTGKLTIDRDIINSYSSAAAGGSAPNLAFFVEGDVEIAPGVSQVDAIIISFPGRIKTCSQYPNPSCQSKLIANGYWAAYLGFQFGRNYFNDGSPNANPAEQIILTGQSIVFPPPGLSRSDGDIESQLKYFDGELPPRLN